MTDLEYGHCVSRGRGMFVDGWGVGPYVITAGGKRFYFEDSAMFGPMDLDHKGEPTNKLISAKSPFWKAWKRWVDEGRRVTEGTKGRMFCVHSDIRKTAAGDEITR